MDPHRYNRLYYISRRENSLVFTPARNYASSLKPASAGRAGGTRGFGGCAPVEKGAARLPPTIKKPRVSLDTRGSKVAATYSPTWCSSTIGARELNFSVRNGKRWILTAITAFLISLGERKLDTYSLLTTYASSLKRSIRDISTDRL